MNHKKIIDTLLKTIETVPDSKVISITRGAHIVGVESRRMGLATWAWSGSHPIPREKLPRQEPPGSAKELAQLIRDDNPLNASLGIAALNALLPDLPDRALVPVNAKQLLLDLGEGKRVAVLGHFPFVEQLRKKFKDLMVFEKKPRPGDIHADLIPEKLPRADLVALTATTISNKTLGDIFASCSSTATKIIVGPSTPLTPALFDLGFDYIAGTIVQDNTVVKQGIAQDIPFKQLKGVKHVIMGKKKIKP